MLKRLNHELKMLYTQSRQLLLNSGKINTRSNRKKLGNKVKFACKFYFGCKVEDQDKIWALHICSTVCKSQLAGNIRGKGNKITLKRGPRASAQPTSKLTISINCILYLAQVH